MDLVLLVARLVLAAVFAVAGVAKLFDLAGSRRAAREFGVPAALSDTVGTALPILEIIIAVALLPLPTARWAAAAALVLLLAFIAAMANQVRRGQHPDCHCFGQLHSKPVGPATIARNGVLAVLAAVVAVAGWNGAGASVVGWTGGMDAVSAATLVAGLVGLVALAGVVWTLVHLMGQNVRMIDRLDAIERTLSEVGAEPRVAPADGPAEPYPGLLIGTQAPAFALGGLFGETTTLDALRAAGQPVMLVFSDPNCGPCNSLMPDVGRWQRERADAFTVALVSSGGIEANRPKAAEHGLTNVLIQRDREVAEAYRADATPAAVVIDAGGAILSPLALGPDAVRELAAKVIDYRAPSVPKPAAAPAPAIQLAPAPAVAANGAAGANGHHPPAPAEAAPAEEDTTRRDRIGQPAPTVDMRDLRGRPVKMSSLRGREVVFLFLNTNTAFSEDMVPDVRALDAAPPPGAPRLVVVSSGSPAGARAMRLNARIVNDPDVRVTHAFGVTGTPAAVLVGADGNIASPVIYGTHPTLALVQGLDPENPPPDGNLRVGRPAPGLEFTTLDGAKTRLAEFRGKPTLVVQWDTACGHCQRMLPDLQALDAAPPKGAPQLVLIARGDPEAVRAMALRSTVILDKDNRGMHAFRTYSTPSAVLIDAEGNIASPIAVGAVEVMPLARATTAEERAAAVAAIGAPAVTGGQQPAAALEVGSPAPRIDLPDLMGERVTLESFRGEKTLVLFWNPGCGFCQKMLDDLKAAEDDPSDGAPRMLIVSTGTVEENRAQGLRSTTVLDSGFSVGATFGASGTPSAVLVDEEGRIASTVVVGARGVLDMVDGDVPSFDTHREDPLIGLRTGADAPALVLPDLDGREVDLTTYRGERVAVVFWDPECGFCQRLLPEFLALEQNPPADAPRIVIASPASADELRPVGFRSTVLVDKDRHANKAFNSWSTPTAIMIDAEGKIASVPAEGGPSVVALIRGEDPEDASQRAMADAAPKPLPIGSAAPIVSLPDINGATVSLDSFRGEPTLLTFWNPDCGYCQQMRPSLLEWEASRSANAPRLVLSALGSAEANRAQGFRSPVLLDERYVALEAFRVTGTPSAILIDAEGKIASDVATGAEQILTLIESATAAPPPSVEDRAGSIGMVRKGGRG